MKMMFVLILLTGVCFALDPDAGPLSQLTCDPVEPETDDWIINIASMNDVSLAWASELRGCDFFEGELFVTDYSLDSIFAVNPNTGAKTFGMPCPPEIPQVLGICCYSISAESFIYINDWDSDTEIYRFSTVSGWSYAFENPSAEPRGMDFDPSLNIWEIDAASHILYVFDIAGTVSESWTLSELPSDYACGCSVFPFGAGLGIIIGGYQYADFYFYSFDGSTLEYLGAAPIPQSASSSYGITWSDLTQSYYWIYKDSGGDFRLCEFTVEFEVTLDQSTWGAVKAGF